MRIFAVGILLIILCPVVLADGNSDYSVIMRNTSIQPSVATVEDGTTLIFYNVVNQTRNLSSSSPAWSCTAGPSDTTSIEDECRLNLTTWEAGEYQIQIKENGTAVETFSFIIAAHEAHSHNDDEHSHADDNVSHQIEEVWVPMVLFVILVGIYWLVFYKK